MPSAARDPAARWFLRIHPLVWVVAGILLLFAAASLVGGAVFTPLAFLGPFGFWVAVTGLVVLLVVLLILTKRRPETEERP